MKKKYKLLLFILFTSCSNYLCNAQKNSLFGELNYNTFSHSDFKSFQEEFISDITDIQLEKNDEFPANIGFTIGYTIKSINTSLFVSYTSTGGKASYSDYSAIIRITQAISGFTTGGEYLIPINKNSTSKGSFDIGIRGFITFSNLEIESYSKLLEQTESESFSFSSLDFGGGIRVIYEYPIAFLRLRATLGMDAVIGGKHHFEDNNDLYLENNSGDPVKNGWTGFRLGLGISIPI